MVMRRSLDQHRIFLVKKDAEEALTSGEEIFGSCNKLIKEIFGIKKYDDMYFCESS